MWDYVPRQPQRADPGEESIAWKSRLCIGKRAWSAFSLPNSSTIICASPIPRSSYATIGSFAQGTARVENGEMTVLFDDANLARSVKAGMDITVGDVTSTVKSVGRSESGAVFALADTILADGVYDARVTYRQTQVITLLFN